MQKESLRAHVKQVCKNDQQITQTRWKKQLRKWWFTRSVCVRKPREDVWQSTSVTKVKNTKSSTIVSEEHWRCAVVLQIDGTKTRTIASACKKTLALTQHYKMDRSRKCTSKNPQHDATSNASKNWEPMDCFSNYSWKIQYDANILNMDKFTALERTINRCTGRPRAKQEVPLRKHNDQERILLLLISAEVWNNTLTVKHITCLTSTTHQTCFQNLFVALPFSQYCCEERVRLKPEWKQGHSWCTEEHIFVVSRLFRFFIHFTDNDGTVALTTLPNTSPVLPRSWLIVYIPCKSEIPASGHFADTNGLTLSLIYFHFASIWVVALECTCCASWVRAGGCPLPAISFHRSWKERLGLLCLLRDFLFLRFEKLLMLSF